MACGAGKAGGSCVAVSGYLRYIHAQKPERKALFFARDSKVSLRTTLNCLNVRLTPTYRKALMMQFSTFDEENAMRALILVAACLLISSTQIQAKTITYEYQGNPLRFAPGYDFDREDFLPSGNLQATNGILSIPAIKLEVTIDLSSIDPQTGFDWSADTSCCDDGFDPLPPYIVEVVSDRRFYIGPSSVPRFAMMTFDQNWNVNSWRIGFIADFRFPIFTSSDGDVDIEFNNIDLFGDFYYTAPGGSWRMVDNTGVAPVPLPATGILLVGGLGGFAVIRRRKMRNAARL